MRLAVFRRTLIGTINSPLHSVQTPIAGSPRGQTYRFIPIVLEVGNSALETWKLVTCITGELLISRSYARCAMHHVELGRLKPPTVVNCCGSLSSNRGKDDRFDAITV